MSTTEISVDPKGGQKEEPLVEEHQFPKEIDQNGDFEKGSSASPNGIAGEDAEVRDKDIVWWDEPVDQDPYNPMNWSPKKKWLNIGILSGITFVTYVLMKFLLSLKILLTLSLFRRPLASSIFAPVVPQVMADFHNDSQLLATFVVSVYLLGFAFGPLLIAPLSEIYGRLLLYHTSNICFVVFTAACALSTSLNMLIGFRFLAGLAGCTVLTIGGGTIADTTPQEKRGGAMAIWSLGPLLGVSNTIVSRGCKNH